MTNSWFKSLGKERRRRGDEVSRQWERKPKETTDAPTTEYIKQVRHERNREKIQNNKQISKLGKLDESDASFQILVFAPYPSLRPKQGAEF